MLAIFESTLPTFLIIASGFVLRRLPIINVNAWAGMEQLCYWFLYPALLFVTIYNADFSDLQLDAMLASLLTAVAIMALLLLAAWPLMRESGLVSHFEYSSVFQTSLRWNGFIALPVAAKIFPPEGAAVVALAMSAIIVPISTSSIFVTVRFANREANFGKILRQVMLNPLLMAVAMAGILRWTPFGLYQPVNDTLKLIGSAGLGLGLMTIGAGLQPRHLMQARFALWMPVVAKLVFFPALLISIALAFGIRGEQLTYLALCAAVPAALNGYILARQLGGDAELYAAVTTLQTALSFFSIPIVLIVVGQLSSG
jgi:malonate transporter